jgi:hypothetical protein
MAYACVNAVQSTLRPRYYPTAFDTCGLSQRNWDGGREVWEAGMKPCVFQDSDPSDPEMETRVIRPASGRARAS